jgi:hypothetical protein
VTQNLSSVYQFRKTGSGQFLQPRLFNRSPGLAKIAPWWLARRDNFLAKVPGLVSAGCATNAFCSYPLAVNNNTQCQDIRLRALHAINFTVTIEFFAFYQICTPTLNWSFPCFISGDKSVYLDSFRRQPNKLADAQIKKLATRHVLLVISRYHDSLSFL